VGTLPRSLTDSAVLILLILALEPREEPAEAGPPNGLGLDLARYGVPPPGGRAVGRQNENCCVADLPSGSSSDSLRIDW
jgi:hypothetical protein